MVSRVPAYFQYQSNTYCCICGERVDINIVKSDVLAIDEEIGPARRVKLRDPFNRQTRDILCYEENGPVVFIVGVLQPVS